MLRRLPLSRPGHSCALATRGAVLPVLAGSAAALMLAGCGGGGDTRTAGDGGSPAAPLSSSATPVSPGPSASTPSTAVAEPSSAGASPRAAGLVGDLVTPAQIPAFGGVDSWAEGATGPAGPEPYGACQEYDFSTIGARKAVVRTFQPSGGAATTTAVERVVSFPDATNAARARKVLDSFRDRCESRVAAQLPHLHVSAPRSVDVGQGTASAYTVTWQPAAGSGATHTQVIGTVANGNLIAVITLETDAGGGIPDAAVTGLLSSAAKQLG